MKKFKKIYKLKQHHFIQDWTSSFSLWILSNTFYKVIIPISIFSGTFFLSCCVIFTLFACFNTFNNKNYDHLDRFKLNTLSIGDHSLSNHNDWIFSYYPILWIDDDQPDIKSVLKLTKIRIFTCDENKKILMIEFDMGQKKKNVQSLTLFFNNMIKSIEYYLNYDCSISYNKTYVGKINFKNHLDQSQQFQSDNKLWLYVDKVTLEDDINKYLSVEEVWSVFKSKVNDNKLHDIDYRIDNSYLNRLNSEQLKWIKDRRHSLYALISIINHLCYDRIVYDDNIFDLWTKKTYEKLNQWYIYKSLNKDHSTNQITWKTMLVYRNALDLLSTSQSIFSDLQLDFFIWNYINKSMSKKIMKDDNYCTRYTIQTNDKWHNKLAWLIFDPVILYKFVTKIDADNSYHKDSIGIKEFFNIKYEKDDVEIKKLEQDWYKKLVDVCKTFSEDTIYVSIAPYWSELVMLWYIKYVQEKIVNLAKDGIKINKNLHISLNNKDLDTVVWNINQAWLIDNTKFSMDHNTILIKEHVIHKRKFYVAKDDNEFFLIDIPILYYVDPNINGSNSDDVKDCMTLNMEDIFLFKKMTGSNRLNRSLKARSIPW